MAGPVIVGIVYSLFIVVLSFLKPNAGRIFLGFFFIAMGIGINLTFLLTNPDFIVEYGRAAWVPFIKTLTERVITLNPALFGVMLILFEVVMGLLMLSKGIWVRAGLIGAMIFVLGLVLINGPQIAWAVSVIAHVYLFTKIFDESLIRMIRRRFMKRD